MSGVRFDRVLVAMVGPFIDWYFDDRSGFHAQAAGGLGMADLGRPRQEVAIREDRSSTGIGVMAGIGYEAWAGDQWSLGALLRVVYVDASEGDSETEWSHQALALPTLLFSATYH